MHTEENFKISKQFTQTLLESFVSYSFDIYTNNNSQSCTLRSIIRSEGEGAAAVVLCFNVTERAKCSVDHVLLAGGKPLALIEGC